MKKNVLSYVEVQLGVRWYRPEKEHQYKEFNEAVTSFDCNTKQQQMFRAEMVSF